MPINLVVKFVGIAAVAVTFAVLVHKALESIETLVTVF